MDEFSPSPHAHRLLLTLTPIQLILNQPPVTVVGLQSRWCGGCVVIPILVVLVVVVVVVVVVDVIVVIVVGIPIPILVGKSLRGDVDTCISANVVEVVGQ